MGIWPGNWGGGFECGFFVGCWIWISSLSLRMIYSNLPRSWTTLPRRKNAYTKNSSGERVECFIINLLAGIFPQLSLLLRQTRSRPFCKCFSDVLSWVARLCLWIDRSGHGKNLCNEKKLLFLNGLGSCGEAVGSKGGPLPWLELVGQENEWKTQELFGGRLRFRSCNIFIMEEYCFSSLLCTLLSSSSSAAAFNATSSALW